MNRDSDRRNLRRPGREAAEALCLQVLAWLLADTDRQQRFLALTGFDGGDLRRLAATPDAYGAILDYLLGDEPLLLAFTTEQDLPPELPALARMALPGGMDGADY